MSSSNPHAPLAAQYANAPVEIPPLPDDATPEQKDEHWLRYVYQGDRMPQLTWRAVLLGGLLGMLMSAANLYTTLSIGWAFGIAITSCVLSFVIWNFVRLCSGNKVSQMSILENACMASCASAAGYSTGSTIATMFGALVLLHDVPEGTSLTSVFTWDITPPWVVVAFTLCTGLMGVFLAIPMKRQQINHEQLPFPSGIAAAETLRSLYSESKEAVLKAYVLVLGLASGLIIGFLRVGDDVLDSVRFLRLLFAKIPFLRIPAEIDLALFNRLYPGYRHAAGFAFEPSALLIAAGMIVGMRTSVSLLVSSLLLYGVVAPQLAAVDATHMARDADQLLNAVKVATKDLKDVAQVRAAAIGAIEKTVDEKGIKLPDAVKAAAKRGAAGADGAIEAALGRKRTEAILVAAEAAGLSGGPIESAARRAIREMNDSADKARSGAAVAAALRLAKAKGADAKALREAVDKAEKAVLETTDKDVGERVLAAIVEAAAAQGADVQRIKAAAAEAAKAAAAGPGRAGAKAAREMAVRIVYDEMENDPAPIHDAADKVAGPANAEARTKVADTIIAAVISEAGKLALDASAIQASAAAAAKNADLGEGQAGSAAALEAALFAASAASKPASAITDAAAKASFDETELEKQCVDVREAIAGAAAGVAARNFADADAMVARDAARDKARAANLSFKKTKEAGDAAFDAGKYRQNFIWNWGGGTITITRWALWGGTAVMVFSSLMSVALQWKTVVRAFSGARSSASEHDVAALQNIEVPGSWMILGMLPITIAMVWLQVQAFGVSWYAGIIAVAMSFVLSLVASRATGETDTTPIGAMGKVMQLMFAVLAPKNIAANLASAGIAANSASSSADLLTDLKTGYLLGANPRRQFLAQFFGVFFGTVAIVPIWYLMVPTRAKLETFALPSTRAWEAVARILVKGVGELPSSAVWAIFIGAAIGVLLPVIERLLSPKARRFMPSAIGIGLAWVMPFQNAFSFFIGAVIVMIWTRLHRRTAEAYNVPLASGLVAGESLMAAALAITATVVGLLAT